MSKQDIEKLENILKQADIAYYNFGDSNLTDEEYDSLVEKLKELDPKNQRFKNKKVGAKEKNEKWKKFDHAPYFMGSQHKINVEEELQKWTSRFTGSYIVQEKLDGVSIKLIYENGTLVSASTRGNGLEGENITKNVIKMEGVPKSITTNNRLVVRGEILLHKSDFEQVGGKNPRNAAAGTAKRLDGVGCEYLTVHVYDIMNWKELNLKSNSDIYKTLKLLHFNVVKTYFCKDAQAIQHIMNTYIESKRKTLDWDIDGLVIKLDVLQDDDWAFPNRQTAYKFPHQMATTKLLDVVWQDSGARICPVGILEPVVISGVTVSKATLNNIDHINDLKIKIGDMVLVSRRNDVIPCIEKVSISDEHGKDIVPPTHDEEGYPIVREVNSDGKELSYLISTNPNSKSSRIRTILSWFESHNLKGIAEATVTSIIDAKIAEDLPSFIKVCLDGDSRLLDIEGFGSSTFNLLHKNCYATKKSTIVQFLNGCDINGVSTKRMETILENINQKINIVDFIEKLKDISFISNLPGFGLNMAQTLRNNIVKKDKLISNMLEIIEVIDWEPAQRKQTRITGLTFCFTGKMDKDRGYYEKLVKESGGFISSSISKKVDYLVTNEPNSGSTKNQKADSLNIPKISEEMFLNML